MMKAVNLNFDQTGSRVVFSVGLGALVGAGMAFFTPTNFINSWLAYSVLLIISFFGLVSAWHWAGGGKVLAWMVILAFVLRLGVGVATTMLLPEYGFDTEQQNAGYLFYDAHQRDLQAWELASSKQPLWVSFRDEFATDQYGGLLSLSAGVYRYLSPDEHRPVLILILAAFAASLGVPFLWRVVSERWDHGVANLAAWIYVLYPDGILFSASQMREPFLIGLICISFWAVINLKESTPRMWWVLALTLMAMGVISSRVTVMVVVVLVVIFWVEKLIPKSETWRKTGWLALAVAGAGLLVLSWEWLQNASAWDILLTELGSGWVQKVIGEIGEWIRVPFVIVYGIAQPVLPAAIAYPTLLIWKIIAIARAAGWYLLVPFLFYSLFTVWKVKEKEERRILLWLMFFVAIWVVISSVRAGGDQWDNPRYRMIFLPWMALLAAWSARWAWEHKDIWLARWLVVEGIFLYYFTNWYFSRYFLLWKRLPFWKNVTRIVVLSAIVLGSGWLWDFIRWLVSRCSKEKMREKAD